MRIAKATGPNAQVIKYDILTALGTHGCAGDKNRLRLVLRFTTLIVARYNWAQDSLVVGQKEIAALWSLDERSVKREMAKLRALGWIEVKRAAARGRVAEYRLQLATILDATWADWHRVGPDFVQRLDGPGADGSGAAGLPSSNIIAFPAAGQGLGQGLWPRLQAMLFSDDPHLYNSWFAALTAQEPEDHVLTLIAPTRFHATYLQTNHAERLLRLAVVCDPDITRIAIIVEPG